MTKIYDATSDDFETALVGRKIVATTHDTITLDSGVVLELEDTSDCCAWFSASDVRLIDTGDNIITAVEEVTLSAQDSAYADDEHYRVRILSNAKEIANFDIEGNASSGYYCHSINLIIKDKEN